MARAFDQAQRLRPEVSPVKIKSTRLGNENDQKNVKRHCLAGISDGIHKNKQNNLVIYHALKL